MLQTCRPTQPSTNHRPSQPERLNPLTERRIRYRADRLARIFRLSADDRDDLYQDLYLAVWEALPKHEPERGTLDAFTRGVMDIWYRQTAREIRRSRQRDPGFVPLPERDAEATAFIDPSARHVQATDIRLDLLPRLARLPRELAEVALLRGDLSVREIAAERGVHRGTIPRAIRVIREELWALNPIPA
jgi:RNA polymerase sigma factor (sigma-70 family)